MAPSCYPFLSPETSGQTLTKKSNEKEVLFPPFKDSFEMKSLEKMDTKITRAILVYECFQNTSVIGNKVHMKQVILGQLP